MTDKPATTAKPKTAAAAATPAVPEKVLERFSKGLNKFLKPDEKLALAVSGGPDSLALLILAAAARPGKVEAATVDHGLRDGSRKEAEDVAALCQTLGVPHEILTLTWDEKPKTGIQARSRAKRYQALGEWAEKRGLGVLVTAHHANDQAETLMMRLARGSGLRGLAGMRRIRNLPNSNLRLARPLLKWTHPMLEKLCEIAGLTPAADPSNEDRQFERVRVREFLAGADWLDPSKLAKTASNIGQADAALRWSAQQEWGRRVTEDGDKTTFDAAGLPPELGRRIVRSIINKMKTEGKALDLRGRELDTVLKMLKRGRKVTLRGVLCAGGSSWTFKKAPARAKVAEDA